MAMDLANYHIRAGDWRAALRKNQRNTIIVIGLFILIYILIGFLLDFYLYSNTITPPLPAKELVHALLTLQLIPYGTIVAGVIAIIAVFITFAFHNKLILLGSHYHEITSENATTLQEKQLYDVVEEMKVAAGLNYLPRIFLIEADYMNAFASGYSEKSAMVAITQGLVEKLDRDELTAVMAHELSHIRHMDIKLTLMASVLSNITQMMIDVMFFNLLMSNRGNGEREKRNNTIFLIVLILRYVFPLITVLLMLYLSRVREYMADAGCVELMRNNEPLARALLKIQQDHANNKKQYAAAYNATAHESIRRQAYIFDPIAAGINADKSVSDFFSTHPNIHDRLAAIGIQKNELDQTI